MRIILGAGEEAEEGPALKGDVIANGAAEHGITGFEGVEDGTLGNRTDYFELDLGAGAGQRAEMSGQGYADHEVTLTQKKWRVASDK